jgi:hypothetical protein
MRRLPLVLAVAAILTTATAHAIEVRVSAEALERTLKAQLFSGPDGRYYLKGSATTPCNVYGENPHITFKDDRVVVHIHTHAKLGTTVYGNCIGVSMTNDADVSFIPEAQGESVGFRDAKIESLSGNKELDFLLVPFLSRKLPQQMKLNAAELMRTLLVQSPKTTGYSLTLKMLKLHSMIVEAKTLIVDLDAALTVE